MSILVLAVEKPYWQDVLIELTKKGLPITHTIVHYRYKNSPKKFFGDFKGVQVDGKQFYRVEDVARRIKEDLGDDFPPIDANIVAAFEPIERDFYNLTDRFCFFPLSFRYRKRLFRESLRYWIGFFEKHKIKAVFNSCTPHNFSDYMAYHVAKYLGIPTVLIAHTMINDHVIIRNDYRGYNKVPADFLSDLSEAEIVQQINSKLYQEAFAESQVLKMVIQKNDQSVKAGNLNTINNKVKFDYKKFAKRLWRTLKRALRFMFIPPIFKGALAMNGLYPPSVRRVLRICDHIWQIRQKAYLRRKSIVPNLNEKYIYFAMHLQPERTSTPEAEIFEDQLLAIEVLARSLPQGWKLFVKENPRQFDKKINLLKGHHHRDKSDYRDILRLPNTHLISQKVSTKDIVKNAQIVSTLSGSVGWEALLAGRPCIIFANAWYSECRSAFRINNIAEAKAAIAEAVTKNHDNVRLDVLKYLAFMKDKYIVGIMGDEVYVRAAKVPYDVLVKSMSDRIYNEFKNISA